MGDILTLETLPAWREGKRKAGRRVVVTNGVFDLMHRGHMEYLEKAAAFGDDLLVLVNDDASVRALKGPSRPIVHEQDRALLLSALSCVSAVVIFHGERCSEALQAAVPDIYAKGGDYTLETLNREEYAVLKECGSRIELLHFVPGCSTTSIVNRIIEGSRIGTPRDIASEEVRSGGRFDPRIMPILSRRSIRHFKPQALENRDLAALLEAGMSAPSAMACYPAEFLLLTDPAELKKASALLPNGHFLSEAGACIIVCGNPEKACGGELSYLIQDCSACIENILIAAARLGIGTCWLGIHPRQERIDNLCKAFSLPQGTIPIGGIALGWPAESKDVRTQYNAEKIHLNRW